MAPLVYKVTRTPAALFATDLKVLVNGEPYLQQYGFEIDLKADEIREITRCWLNH